MLEAEVHRVSQATTVAAALQNFKLLQVTQASTYALCA